MCINTISAICNGEKVHKNFLVDYYDSAKKQINIQKLEVVFFFLNKLNKRWHLRTVKFDSSASNVFDN